MTPVASAELIASLVPAELVRVECFAACGHGTHRDQPQRTETAIGQFLAGASKGGQTLRFGRRAR